MPALARIAPHTVPLCRVRKLDSATRSALPEIPQLGFPDSAPDQGTVHLLALGRPIAVSESSLHLTGRLVVVRLALREFRESPSARRGVYLLSLLLGISHHSIRFRLFRGV